jgi:hypothetical protein
MVPQKECSGRATCLRRGLPMSLPSLFMQVLATTAPQMSIFTLGLVTGLFSANLAVNQKSKPQIESLMLTLI